MAQEIYVSHFQKISTETASFKYNLRKVPVEGSAAIIFQFPTNKKNFRIGVDYRKGRGGIISEYASVIYVPIETEYLTLWYKDTDSFSFQIPTILEKDCVYEATVEFEHPSKKGVQEAVIKTVHSSDIRIVSFELNPKVIIGSVNPIYDNSGQACAVIRYFVNDSNFVIEPNLGELKTIKKTGQILQYVPVGTRRLTIRNENYMPLNGYDLPVDLEQKATYDATIALTESAIRRKKASPDHDNFLGIGYNNPELSFYANGGTRKITIHCNTTWDISAPSWCKLSKTSGAGVMEIEVTAKSNSSPKMRRGVIGIQSQDITVTINVEQEGE